ncbi:MAG TPA: multicopper oxidase domain-containing protein [Longimicrobium sp.]|nr:multicopper oxidase domain-containing protein [Longimicrobium sp.]
MSRRIGPAPPWRRLGLAALLTAAAAGPAHAQCTTANTVTANVVALDQFIWYNRLGAHDPSGMMFALAGDVVSSTGGVAGVGNARLRDGKRPRPLTLRVNAGGCLKINFRNLLSTSASGSQPGTRAASIHVVGMQVVGNITDDGTNVQNNPTSGLVEPGGTRTYTLYAEKEGTFLLHSAAQTTGGEGDGGQIARGLFGAVNVQPAGAEYYRSQVTAADLRLATKKDGLGNPIMVGGYPDIDYLATYPVGHALYPRPILKMTNASNELVHSELSAIITGPSRGNFPSTSFPNVNVPASPERTRPFREYTVIFHDEAGLTQAFEKIFDDEQFEYTLEGSRDAFGINYGTGGIGAEILANRFGLGPMWQCNDCKFEEFFLSSWAVGDPAMVVDVPAAADFDPAAPVRGPRATRTLYPDDPSNVFHSYLNDHVKIRNLHAGPKEHHIFHLHAHQWLHSPNNAESNYLDSQAIGPGAGFTYEITYGGSGNRNETVGDAILHCHFYPHFAQGMWALWRTHDVFEAGTQMGTDGRPAAGSRALPDGEIAAGTPIPAVVPMPGYALAPVPTVAMPGFPFYIPGKIGHRPPKPPLDTEFDGGLPRHVVTGGVATFPALNTRDFSKHDDLLAVQYLPEAGTTLEQNAMAFHASTGHATRIAGNLAAAGTFTTNGRPAAKGAPFADPCGLNGVARGTPRTYKGAAFQTSVTYNKAGWSFPQHRMFSLWEDVNAVRAGTQAPEPLFMRAHSNDCISYHFVNLVPKEWKQDDYQVTTPTDVIGQHIHLVKFDVTASDGAANGWNYEDGSLSPGDVQDRVRAVRKQNGCTGVNSGDARDGTGTCPVAKAHPFFGNGPNNEWVGAQETVQRWWVDPILRSGGAEGRLGTVFTHDHYGPSTHQQAGLYAGLVVEDAGTVWRNPETGTQYGGRADGGPTSWRADILYPATPDRNFREFNLQIADFALAYGREGFETGVGPTGGVPAINPPGKHEVGLPNLIRPPQHAGICPNGVDTPPCPEIIALDDPGTMLVNYRNEPIAMRVRNPANTQAGGLAGDLSHAYSSQRTRDDGRLNTFGPYGQRVGEQPRDPFTPLLRAYEDDKILVRLLVGAHEEGHNFAVSGTRWLFGPRDKNSGWRNSQMAGISEYYEFGLDPLLTNASDTIADYLYQGGAAVDDQWNGAWGIIRSYRRRQANLLPLQTSRISFSFDAALQDAAASRTALPDGYAPSYPIASSPTSYTGSTATADQEMTQQKQMATMQVQSTSSETLTAAEQDSVVSGFGNESTGGAEHLAFEYDPATGTEYVISSDSVAAEKGLVATGTTTVEVAEPEYAERSSTTTTQTASTTSTTYETSTTWSGSGGTNRGFYNTCPRIAPMRYFDISAVLAQQALPEGTLRYNTRTVNGGELHDPTAIMYVYTSDIDSYTKKLKASAPREPLVLRANAGDCIHVRLHNRLPALATSMPDLPGYNTLPTIIDRFNANEVRPSNYVGLHPQLVAFDVQRSDGHEVGINRNTMVAPGTYRDYVWYAGDIQVKNNRIVGTPIEFGAINLTSSDRIKHSNKGGIASLVIEPQGTFAVTDPNSRATATIRRSRDGAFLFREMVLLFQDDVNLRFARSTALKRYDCLEIEEEEEKLSCATGTPGTQTFAAGSAVPNLAEAEDPEDSGQKGLNYRTEPMWFRMGFAPNAELEYTRGLNFRDALKGAAAQTPILTANPGEQVRIRLLQPGGHARNHVFALNGHAWEELPYVSSSASIGANPLSEVKGARDGHGPSNHHDIIPKNGAGGKYKVPGDYLYRDQASFLFDGGIWGLLRVKTPSTTTTTTSPTPTTPTNPTPTTTSPTTTSPTTTSPTTTTTSPTMTSTSTSVQSTPTGGCVVDAKTGKTTCS